MSGRANLGVAFFKISGALTLAALLFIFAKGDVLAASIVFEPSEWTIGPGQVKVVSLNITTLASEPINAFELTLTIPPGLVVLAADAIETEPVLWVKKPIIAEGTVNLSGGFTTPVTDFQQLAVLTITAASEVSGGRINLANSSRVLRADGFGSAVNLATSGGIFKGGATGALQITSPSHPDESAWSRLSTWELRWLVPENTRFSYSFSESPGVLPDKEADQPVGKIAYPDLPDGIFVFKLLSQKDAAPWQFENERLVKIDTHAPEPFKISQSNDVDAGRFLIFVTYDKMSGIDRYEVKEGKEGEFIPAASPYLIKDQAESHFEVRAIDRASHFTTASVDFGTRSSLFNKMLSTLLIFLVIYFKLRQPKANS